MQPATWHSALILLSWALLVVLHVASTWLFLPYMFDADNYHIKLTVLPAFWDYSSTGSQLYSQDGVSSDSKI